MMSKTSVMSRTKMSAYNSKHDVITIFLLWDKQEKETVITSIIDTSAITQVRKKMPYLKDIQNR